VQLRADIKMLESFEDCEVLDESWLRVLENLSEEMESQGRQEATAKQVESCTIPGTKKRCYALDANVDAEPEVWAPCMPRVNVANVRQVIDDETDAAQLQPGQHRELPPPFAASPRSAIDHRSDVDLYGGQTIEGVIVQVNRGNHSWNTLENFKVPHCSDGAEFGYIVGPSELPIEKKQFCEEQILEKVRTRLRTSTIVVWGFSPDEVQKLNQALPLHRLRMERLRHPFHFALEFGHPEEMYEEEVDNDNGHPEEMYEEEVDDDNTYTYSGYDDLEVPAQLRWADMRDEYYLVTECELAQ